MLWCHTAVPWVRDARRWFGPTTFTRVQTSMHANVAAADGPMSATHIAQTAPRAARRMGFMPSSCCELACWLNCKHILVTGERRAGNDVATGEIQYRRHARVAVSFPSMLDTVPDVMSRFFKTSSTSSPVAQGEKENGKKGEDEQSGHNTT